MKVKELIKQLQSIDGDARVIISDMDGDEHPFGISLHDEGYEDNEKEVDFIINLYKGDGWSRDPFCE